MIRRIIGAVCIWGAIFCSQLETKQTSILNIVSNNRAIQAIIAGYLLHWHECAALKGHKETVFSLAYSPDGSYLATGSADKTIKIWNTETYRLEKTLKDHTRTIFSLAFLPSLSPKGSILASGSEDRTVKIWNTRTHKLLQTITGHNDSVCAIVFSPNAKHLVTGSTDNIINIWDCNTYKQLHSLTQHQNGIVSLEYTPDGVCLMSDSEAGRRYIWQATRNYKLLTTEEIDQLAHVKINGKDYIFMAKGSEIVISDHTQQTIAKLSGHTDAVIALAISPHDRFLASGSFDGTVHIWRNNTNELRNFVISQTPEQLFRPVHRRIVSETNADIRGRRKSDCTIS